MSAEQTQIFTDRDKFGPSGRYDVNFYFELGNLGISDNHRMAYPFFIRQRCKGVRLVHMDAHLDCELFLKEDQDALAQIDPAADLNGFVRFKYYDHRACAQVCPVSYGNWITALLHTHPHMIVDVAMVCGRPLGTIRQDMPMVRPAAEDVLWEAGESACRNRYYSIDIDYYFDEHYGHAPTSEYSDPYRHFDKCLRHSLVESASPVFVALSPEFCGGWKQVVPFLQIIDRVADTSLAMQLQEYIP